MTCLFFPMAAPKVDSNEQSLQWHEICYFRADRALSRRYKDSKHLEGTSAPRMDKATRSPAGNAPPPAISSRMLHLSTIFDMRPIVSLSWPTNDCLRPRFFLSTRFSIGRQRPRLGRVGVRTNLECSGFCFIVRQSILQDSERNLTSPEYYSQRE